MKNFNFAIVSSLLLLAVGCSQGARQLSAAGGQPGSNGLQVNMTWNSNLGEQEEFYIEESTDGVNFSQILTVPDGTNSAAIVVPGHGKYYFRVRGYNQAGDSPYSPVITAII